MTIPLFSLIVEREVGIRIGIGIGIAYQDRDRDQRMRLFIAVELDHAVREQLARALEPLRALPELPRGVRWLPADNWHLTLQFLGNVQDAALDAVRAAVRQAGTAVPAFELVLGGAGAFDPRAARVLWLGVQSGGAQVAALAAAVTARTGPLGFAPEEREFSAHVTLARCKPPADLRPLLPRMRLGPLGQPVTHVALMRSHVSSQGARYETLLRTPLMRSP